MGREGEGFRVRWRVGERERKRPGRWVEGESAGRWVEGEGGAIWEERSERWAGEGRKLESEGVKGDDFRSMADVEG